MAIKTKFFRTYIICVKTPKGVFWYGGKHESYKLDPKADKYPGSGKILWNIYKKYGLNYRIRWFGSHGTIEKSFSHERYLISILKQKHNKNCINIDPGGRGPKGKIWTEEQCIIHKLKLNRPETKAKMQIAQSIAQNRPERKSRQSEVMKNFYANGGSSIISEATSRAQRKAPHWHEPLRTEIYNIWLSLGKPTTGPVVKALKGKYDVTGSALKNLIYSFRKIEEPGD